MLINVIGAERTGSTLLDVLLGHGDEVFSCGEISFRFRPMRTHDFIFDCSCQDPNCSVWKKLENISEKDIHNQLLKEFDFVIDSSKHLVWVMDSIESLSEHHTYVNIATWKDPKKILYSHWKRGNNLTKAFRQYLKYYNQLLQCQLPFMTINHEDLINNTVPFLKHIEKITGLKYFEGKENFWNEPNHHFLFGSNGIRKQVRHSSSVVYKEEMDPKFDEIYEDFSDRVLVSSDSTKTFDELKARSVFNYDQLPKMSNEIVKPSWYYIKKYGRMLRRYLPVKFEVKDVQPKLN